LSDQRELLVIVPTYEEADNVEPISRRVLAVLPAAHVLFVNDPGGDGTEQRLAALEAADPRVHVLTRSGRRGLGPALRDGFAWALGGPWQVVVHMDADESHDPAHLPGLISTAREHGVALGSRYVPGGRVEDWGLSRRLISRWGSFYARTILGLPVRDLTGGYKAMRRDALEALAGVPLDSTGYSFQIEVTLRLWQAGFRPVEVPIVFRDRLRGRTKMRGRIVWEASWRVWALRLRPARRAPAAPVQR
jgi:dolichol-phosphate mannosyltransferase